MAYSKRWFKYVDDIGSVYAINADESNTELVNLNTDSQAVIAAGTKSLPRGIKPRHVMLQSDDGLIKRKCYVLTQERYSDLLQGASYTLGANQFFGVQADTPVLIALKTPEISRRQPYQGDTQLIDGDNP